MSTSQFAGVVNGDNRFTRKWGTRGAQVAEPYITGYHFTNWVYLPTAAIRGQLNFAGAQDVTIFANDAQIKNILASLCLSVSIPGRTVNPVEMQGLGGLKWRAVGSIDEGNDLSMRFLELQDLPIHRIFHGWTKGMRDNRSGTTFLQGNSLGSNSTYNKSNYAGTLYYWTTQPNGYDLAFASCYTGVFPLKDPSDVFSHDIGAIDKLEIDIDFSTDYSYQEGWVYEKCRSFVQNNSFRAWNSSPATTAATGNVADDYAQEER